MLSASLKLARLQHHCDFNTRKKIPGDQLERVSHLNQSEYDPTDRDGKEAELQPGQ